MVAISNGITDYVRVLVTSDAILTVWTDGIMLKLPKRLKFVNFLVTYSACE